MLALCLLGGAMLLLGGASLVSGRRVAPPLSLRHPSLHASSADSVVVFAIQKYVHSGGSSSWTLFDDSFTADTVGGRRYVVEVVNGTTAASGVLLSINGQEFVGSSEFGTSTSRILREVDVSLGSNSITTEVKGSGSAWVNVRVVRVWDPTFVVYGPTTFTYTNGSPQIDIFSISSAAKSPYTLRAINGSPTGSNRLTNATLWLNGSSVMSSSDLGTGIATVSKTVTLSATNNRDSLQNQSGSGTKVSLRYTATDSTPPVLAISAPVDTFSTRGGVRVNGTVSDETHGILAIDTTSTPARPALPTPGAFSDSLTLQVDKFYALTAIATNSAHLSSTVARAVIRDTRAPTLTLKSPAADTTVTADTLRFVGSWNDSSRVTVAIDGDTVSNAAPPFIRWAGQFDYKYALDLGPNHILVRGTDAAGNVSSIYRTVFRATIGDSPPGPLTAQGIKATSSTPFLPSVAFLFRGGTQTVPDTTKFVAQQAAVIRGVTVGRDYGAIGNVKVQILGHQEFGSTVSRSDGQFDLLVNGGGPLTVRFTKAGYVETQRTVNSAWNDYTVVDTVAMIGLSAKSTTFANSSTGVADSRFATDANGDRNMRLVIPQGTTATVTTTGGTTQSYSTMTVRAKEFTIGGDGPKAMPASLPPTSAYTYCVDLRLDQADTLGHGGDTLVTTTFSKPVGCFLKNFLHQDVGTRVPLGYYDQGSARWKAANDGVVAKILSFSSIGDTARIDSRGTGAADDSIRLAQLGITGEELTHLRDKYAVGDTVIRVAVDHFSWWDINYNLAALIAALGRAFGRIRQQLHQLAEACLGKGSIIECENRILGERFAIPGTPYSINYRSSRALGDLAIRTLEIPVIGASVPSGLNRIHVILDVAGRHYSHTLLGPFSTSTPPDTFTWDGLDVYGRRVEGSVNGTVAVGYDYTAFYAAGGGGPSFNDATSNGTTSWLTTGDRNTGRITWTHQRVSLGAPSTASDGLGGWTLSAHHVYDPNGNGALYLGDGRVLFGDEIPPTIHRVSVPDNITGVHPYSNVCIGPDGSLFTTDDHLCEVIRIKPDGTFQTLAGTGVSGLDYGGDGLGTSKTLPGGFTGLAFAADGSLYFTCMPSGHPERVMLGRIDSNGYVKKILGAGADSHDGTGDGGPTASATLCTPIGVAVGADGSVFFAENDDHVVRRISPAGIVTRYAGVGSQTAGAPTSDSTGAATKIMIGAIASIQTDNDGNLYICEPGYYRIRQVTPDGTVSTWLSGPTFTFQPYGVTIAPDGSAFISSHVGDPASNSDAWHRVWLRTTDGQLAPIAGGGLTAADGTPAAAAELTFPTSIAVAQDGSYYLGHGDIHHISRGLGTVTGNELAIPSPDGSEIFFFSTAAESLGRHLRTRDAMTGAVRYRFGYDAAGQLAWVTDVNGLTTTIQRDPTTTAPIAILGPFGQRTRIALDANGFLAALQDTLDHSLSFATYSSGLLWQFTDAVGNTHSFTFGSDGRLSVDADPIATGGSQTFSHVNSGLTRTVTKTTADSRTTTYAVTDSSDGARRREIVGPDNLHTIAVEGADSKLNTQLPDGSALTELFTPDSRFGLVVPVSQSSTIGTPAGLSRVIGTTQSWSGTFDSPLSHGMWTRDTKVNGCNYRSEFHSNYPDSLIWRSASPLGRVSNTSVDTAGRPVFASAPGLVGLQYGYDAQGRPIHIQVGKSSALRYTYDARGRLTSIQDTLLRAITLGYDNADRATGITLPDGRQIQIGYDANGNVTSVTPPGGHAHQFDYSAVDQALHYTPPTVSGVSSPATAFSYNIDHQLTKVARPDGALISLAYSGTKERLDSITVARGRSTLFYNATTGLLDSLSSPDTVSVRYTRDGELPLAEQWAGRLPSISSVTVSRTFNPQFQESTQTVGSTSAVTFLHDVDGLLTGAGPLEIHRNTQNGLVDSTQVSNVISGQDYDSLGNVMNLRYRMSDGSILFQQSFTRDVIGRITQIVESAFGTNRTYGYRYDAAGRLYGATLNSDTIAVYGYDADGNRTSFRNPQTGDTASATYDEQDRMLRYKDTRYTYNAAGDLASKTAGSSVTRYTYDALGSLLKVVLPGGDSITYSVDGTGRRVGRRVNGVWSLGWVYEGPISVVGELDSTGAMLNRYIYGADGQTPALIVRGGTTYRVIVDQTGSVRGIVNSSDGSVLQQIDYDAWGLPTVVGGLGVQSLGYAGGLTDASTGLVRFGARDYDPELGRWTIRDPLTASMGGGSLYAYCSQNPVNFVDPTGTSPIRSFFCGLLEATVITAATTAIIVAIVAIAPTTITTELLITAAIYGCLQLGYETGQVITGTVVEYGGGGPTVTEMTADERAERAGGLVVGWAGLAALASADNAYADGGLSIDGQRGAGGYEARWGDTRVGWHGFRPIKGSEIEVALPHYHRPPTPRLHHPWQGGF